MTPHAEAVDATRRFGELVAVDHASLVVYPGEVLGLLGANGAGKTTLIRLLLGLLTVSDGQVRLFGERPSTATRRRIGYVPQSLGLWEDLTVEENLRFASAAFGATGRPILADDLVAVRDTVIGDLPLGLRRRVAFAAALSHAPDLLILDEPTSGVDPLARSRLWDTLREAVDAGAGALVTTHYMDESAQCDRLVVMAGGRVVATGSIADVVGDATAVEVRAERWQEAFGALDVRGMPLSLSGRTLRVPDGDPAGVVAVLREAGVRADVRVVPATFDEVFVSLTLAASTRAAVAT